MSDTGGVLRGAEKPRTHALHLGWATWFTAELILATAGLVVEWLAFQRAIEMILLSTPGGWGSFFSALGTLVFMLCYARVQLYSITLVHRYFTHRSFETYWWVRAIIIALFHSTLEGLVILWRGWHLQHHAVPDTALEIG